MFLIVSLALLSFSKVIVSYKCLDIPHQASNYHLVRRNSRFDGLIISQKQLGTLKECKHFSSSKKALAFNYSAKKIGDPFVFNCQVLSCPEINSLGSINVKGWKYFSLYDEKNFATLYNDTVMCLPSVGLFIRSNRLANYSQAQESCRKVQSRLAHIASAERSVGLAKFITSPAYIGLSNRGDERLWKNDFDEPLSCFDYRGWAKGEPSGSRGCSILNNSTNLSSSTWRVVRCSTLLPFICEILPIHKN